MDLFINDPKIRGVINSLEGRAAAQADLEAREDAWQEPQEVQWQ